MIKKIIILFLSFILLSTSFYSIQSKEIIKNGLNKSIFRITGLTLLILWIIILLKKDVKDINIIILFILTLIWQFYRHFSNILSNNLSTETKDTSAFYFGLLILSLFNKLYEKTNIRQLFLLLFLLEQRYRSGEIVKL